MNVVFISGMPCCGKTVTTNVLAIKLRYLGKHVGIIEVSDVVRQWQAVKGNNNLLNTDLNSIQLANLLWNQIQSYNELGADFCLVSGAREQFLFSSPRKFVDCSLDTISYYINASYDVRLENLKHRLNILDLELAKAELFKMDNRTLELEGSGLIVDEHFAVYIEEDLNHLPQSLFNSLFSRGRI
jgi:hypothetical protein